MIATKYKNNDAAAGIERTRPLCAFPGHAELMAKGDKSKAESFRCVEPR